MKTHSILFTLGLVVVIMAFFDFPFPHIFDKWILVVVGGLISFFSYTLINENRAVNPQDHETKQQNNTYEEPTI